MASFLHASKHGKRPDEFKVGIHDFQKRYRRGAITPGAIKGAGPTDYSVVLEIAYVIEGFDPTYHGPIVDNHSPKAKSSAGSLLSWLGIGDTSNLENGTPKVAILRRKPGVTDAAIFKIWEQYSRNPA
jgi:hypothetical protein